MRWGWSANILIYVVEVGLPVADSLREVCGVDEVEGFGPEPGFFEVIDFEDAIFWNPTRKISFSNKRCFVRGVPGADAAYFEMKLATRAELRITYQLGWIGLRSTPITVAFG